MRRELYRLLETIGGDMLIRIAFIYSSAVAVILFDFAGTLSVLHSNKEAEPLEFLQAGDILTTKTARITKLRPLKTLQSRH